MKARQFHDHLEGLQIPIEGVCLRGELMEVFFKEGATPEQREKAEEELRRFKPTDEQVAQSEDRRVFALNRNLIESVVEAFKSPRNLTVDLVMQDAERRYLKKQAKQRKQERK